MEMARGDLISCKRMEGPNCWFLCSYFLHLERFSILGRNLAENINFLYKAITTDILAQFDAN